MRAVECPICYDKCRLYTVCGKGCQNVCATCAKRLDECPICRGKLLEAFIPNLGLEVAMQDVLRTCAFSTRGCNALVHVADTVSGAHEASCDRRPVPCSHAGCGKVMSFLESRAHEEACDHRAATCAHAGCEERIVGREAIDAHKAGCAHRLRRCPLRCVVAVKHRDMMAHLRDAHRATMALGDAVTQVAAPLVVTVRAGQPLEVLSAPLVAQINSAGDCLIVQPVSNEFPFNPRDGDLSIGTTEWLAVGDANVRKLNLKTMTVCLHHDTTFEHYAFSATRHPILPVYCKVRKVMALLKVRAVEGTFTANLKVTWT